MLDFKWEILEIFATDGNITKVHYLLSAKDEENTVQTEGYHQFSEGVVAKPFEEIKEEDLIRWLNKDTTKDDVNIIKLNLQDQLDRLKSNQKVSFPWEIDTFTIE